VFIVTNVKVVDNVLVLISMIMEIYLWIFKKIQREDRHKLIQFSKVIKVFSLNKMLILKHLVRKLKEFSTNEISPLFGCQLEEI